MEKLFIFGASKLGEMAYSLAKDTYKIQGFIDNDIEKHGKTFCQLPVYSPSIISDIACGITIASSYWKEIEQQLISMNFYNYQIVKIDYILPNLSTSQIVNQNINSVSAGAIISSVNQKLSVNDLSFLNGGSTIMDYLFLKAVAIKLEARTFLEIGTWTGESVANIAEVVDQCYSISLADNNQDLINIFNKYCNKDNFSRYFSRNKKNIINYEENSFEFDYDKIPGGIDLVFIDGDHSYQGIRKDTENIFNKCGYEDTVIIWHDFKTPRNELIQTTFEAVKVNIPTQYLGNLFAVQGNLCGIYIPSKYKKLLEVKEHRNQLYSYEVNINAKINNI